MLPLFVRSHLEKLVEYCDIAVKEGATLVYGERRIVWSSDGHLQIRRGVSHK